MEKLLKTNQINDCKIVVIDASDVILWHIVSELNHIVVLKAYVDETIDIEDTSIYLIACFDVLHSIPNVSFILSELKRALTESGRIIIREPINPRGDWRTVRNGCTVNERGIAPEYFQQICHQNHLHIIKQRYALLLPLVQIVKSINMGNDRCC